MPSPPQIRIDLSAASPAYRQIVDQIRTLMMEGRLQPGDALPSVRRLAIDLGIHFNTVAEAYRTLDEEGLIQVSHGRAARVRDLELPARASDETVQHLRQRLRNLIAEMRAQGLSPARISRELHSLAEGLRK